MKNTASIPAHPAMTEDTKPFWEGTAQGKLRVKHCAQCGQAHHYPRAVCPFCSSQSLDWRDCVGTGTVYSFSITRPRGVSPYAVAYVALPEGVTLLTQIVDSDFDTLKIGDAVSVVFRESKDGLALPYFKKG